MLGRGVMAGRNLRPRRPDAVALLCYLACAAILFRKAWADATTAWIGTPGDPPLHMWFLHWTPWAVLEGRNPLFSDHVNFPDGVNLMWNTFMPLTGLVVAPFTFTVGVVAAYNVVITGGVVLSAWTAYRVLRRYVRPSAAALGGLVFGFSPYVVAHARTHANLVQVFLVPLFVVFVDELAVRQRRPPLVMGVLLGLVVAAQLYISEELLVYEALASGLAVIILAATNAALIRARARYFLSALVAAVVTALVLTGPALAFQFGGPRRVSSGVLQSPEIRSSDALSFVVPTELQQIEPAWATEATEDFTDSCCVDEWGSYLGVPLIGLLVIVALRWRRLVIVRVASLVGFVFAVLSMGPHLHIAGDVTSIPLPFRALEEVPVIGNVQPRRFMLVTWLCAAILIAVLADALLRARRRRSGTGFVLLGASLLPLVPTFDFPSTRDTTPHYFSSAVADLAEGSVVLIAPFARDTSTSEPMLWQATAQMRFKMPEGYLLGPDPSGRFSFLPHPSDLSIAMQAVQRGERSSVVASSERRALRTEIEQRSVDAVVVGPMARRSAMVRFFIELLGRPPERLEGIEFWNLRA